MYMSLVVGGAPRVGNMECRDLENLGAFLGTLFRKVPEPERSTRAMAASVAVPTEKHNVHIAATTSMSRA